MTEAKKAPAKSSTWSDAQVAQLEKAYMGSESNGSLDTMIAGKTAAAVRSKLVSLGLYEKAAPTSKTGAPVGERKGDLVKAIEILTGVKTGMLDTLEKASKPQLAALAEALTKLSDRDNAENLPANTVSE
jgi:hypothetical protein